MQVLMTFLVYIIDFVLCYMEIIFLNCNFFLRFLEIIFKEVNMRDSFKEYVAYLKSSQSNLISTYQQKV